MVAAVEQGPIAPLSMEKAAMKSKERKHMRITLEIAAAIFGILLASWTGPTVKEALAPKIKIVCPVCGGWVNTNSK